MSVNNSVVRKRLQNRKSSQQNQPSSQDLLTDPFAPQHHPSRLPPQGRKSAGMSPAPAEAERNTRNVAVVCHNEAHGGRCRYSTTRLTTGIACLDGDQLSLVRTGTAWGSRETRIPGGFQPTLIALDGPLLPRGADKLIRRSCESVFIHAPFHNRCKPGLSHWGWGLELKCASAEVCA